MLWISVCLVLVSVYVVFLLYSCEEVLNKK